MVSKRCRTFLGDDDEVVRRRQPVLVETKKFAKTAFRAIAFDRVPHALADRYPQTRELQAVGPQDDRVVFRVAPSSVPKSDLKVLPVSNSFLFTKPERASGKRTDASLRGLRRILLVLSLTDPSHLFRRPVAFSLLPFCG